MQPGSNPYYLQYADPQTTSLWNTPASRSIYGSGGFQPPFNPSIVSKLFGPGADQSLQAMLPFFGSMFGGMGSMTRNPLAPSTLYNYSFMQMQAQQAAAIINSGNYGNQANVESARLTAMFTAMGLKPDQAQSMGTGIRSIARNPFAQMILGAAGVDLSSILPYSSMSADSISTLIRSSPYSGIGMDPRVLAGYASSLAESAGFTGYGFSDPTLAQGFSVNQHGAFLSRMASRGIISMNADALIPQFTKDAAGQEALGRAIAARGAEQLKGYMPALSLVRDQYGITNPDDAVSFLQQITGEELGNMTPQAMRTQVAKLKELQDAFGISIEAVQGFVDATSRLAQSVGVSRSAAISLSLDSLVVGSTSAQMLADSRAGLGASTPGISAEAQRYQEASQRSRMSALGSSLATRVANLSQLLSITPLKGTSPVTDAVQRMVNGTATSDDLTLLRNQSYVANEVARVTGKGASDVSRIMNDTVAGQQLLSDNPAIAGYVADMQTKERTLRVASKLNRATKLGLKTDDADTLLNIAAVYGGGVDKNLGAIRDRLNKFGLKDVANQSDEALTSTILTARSIANYGSGARNAYEAQNVLASREARESIKALNASAGSSAELQAAFGGLPAIEAILKNMTDATDVGGILKALLGSDANFVDSLESIVNAKDPRAKMGISTIIDNARGSSKAHQALATKLAARTTNDTTQLGKAREAIIKGLESGKSGEDILRMMVDLAKGFRDENKKKADDEKKREDDAKKAEEKKAELDNASKESMAKTIPDLIKQLIVLVTTLTNGSPRTTQQG